MKLCLSTLSRHVRAVEVQLHPFLTLVPDDGGLSTSRSISLSPGKIPRYLHAPHRGSGRFPSWESSSGPSSLMPVL